MICANCLRTAPDKDSLILHQLVGKCKDAGVLKYNKKQLINYARLNNKTLWWACTIKSCLYIIDNKDWVDGNYCIGPYLHIEDAYLAATLIGWLKNEKAQISGKN